MLDHSTAGNALTAIQKAFGKQAIHYDQDDYANPILNHWRHQVYRHVDRFLTPGNRILELNAGTGIDALYFAQAGHPVHATDISPGMIRKIKEKIDQFHLDELVTVQDCSFESLHLVQQQKFDYIFSNFGGLNCCSDLGSVAKPLPQLLNKGGYVTWVIMPPVCPWELAGIFKGNKAAFRRLMKGGTTAYLEGETFMTYYHSLSIIRQKLGRHFQFLKAEGLGALSPPPSSLKFSMTYPKTAFFLEKINQWLRMSFPFNRCADHIIVTFQYCP